MWGYSRGCRCPAQMAKSSQRLHADTAARAWGSLLPSAPECRLSRECSELCPQEWPSTNKRGVSGYTTQLLCPSVGDPRGDCHNHPGKIRWSLTRGGSGMALVGFSGTLHTLLHHAGLIFFPTLLNLCSYYISPTISLVSPPPTGQESPLAFEASLSLNFFSLVISLSSQELLKAGTWSVLFAAVSPEPRIVPGTQQVPSQCLLNEGVDSAGSRAFYYPQVDRANSRTSSSPP